MSPNLRIDIHDKPRSSENKQPAVDTVEMVPGDQESAFGPETVGSQAGALDNTVGYVTATPITDDEGRQKDVEHFDTASQATLGQRKGVIRSLSKKPSPDHSSPSPHVKAGPFSSPTSTSKTSRPQRSEISPVSVHRVVQEKFLHTQHLRREEMEHVATLMNLMTTEYEERTKELEAQIVEKDRTIASITNHYEHELDAIRSDLQAKWEHIDATKTDRIAALTKQVADLQLELIASSQDSSVSISQKGPEPWSMFKRESHVSNVSDAWLHERKHIALYSARRYSEAVDVLSIMETSLNDGENTITIEEARAAISKVVSEIFKRCPTVLIDVSSGHLCDTHERVRIFESESESPFKKLLYEVVVGKAQDTDIVYAVTNYFKWVMFSHTWDGREPTFTDLKRAHSVWDLDSSPLNRKLQKFCATACEDGNTRWAWSDTCCIDKTTSAVLSRSLISMYDWYAGAAKTIVYLSDVELENVTESRWMTRAWPLQELLASKVVRFYNKNWKLYLNDTSSNHKESPAIKEELARAMGVAAETIASFHPKDLGVREKLRLASTRNATVEEDHAYSLIGIFSSDIVPRYGIGKIALGYLLEDIFSRSGDTAVIAWTGKSSEYNSALPNTLSVYSRTPHTLQATEGGELDSLVAQVREKVSQESALSLYSNITRLPRPTILNRCLQLPCLVFSVTRLGVEELDIALRTYRALVPLLGKVEFRTADPIPLRRPQELFIIHPWLHDLRDPLDEFSGDESDSESASGSDEDAEAEVEVEAKVEASSDAGSEEVASPLHAEHFAQIDGFTTAFRLIARLGRPFNALLVEQQRNGQFRRIAAEHEIMVPGIPYRTEKLAAVQAKVLEIV